MFSLIIDACTGLGSLVAMGLMLGKTVIRAELKYSQYYAAYLFINLSSQLSVRSHSCNPPEGKYQWLRNRYTVCEGLCMIHHTRWGL